MKSAQPLLRFLPYLMAAYACVEFYPFRLELLYIPHVLFALSCLVLLAIYPNTKFIGNYNFRPVLFLVFWLIFNLASYIWAQDRKEVLLYSLWILRYIILFVVFGKLFTKQKYLDYLPRFLAGIVVVYIITAIWEMLTFSHLPTSRYYGRITYLPTGPFYNENNLAAYFLLFSPFLLFVPKLSLRKGWGLLSGILILIITVIITIQGARIGMLFLGIFLLYYFVFQIKWQHKIALVMVLSVLVASIYIKFGTEIDLIYKVVQSQATSLGNERNSAYLGSLQIREQLMKEGFAMSARNAFIGVGGGNFETELLGEAMLRTGWIANPHNFLLELFGNWGIIVTGFFVYIYLHWLIGLWHLYRKSVGRERLRYLMYLCSLLLFLPASMLPSTIRWNYFVWIYFAAINATLHTNIQTKPASEVE